MDCIRVGLGGVMLLYYSLYKVVENFCVLEVLYLNCIDFGVGRVFGGMLIVICVF